MVFPFRNEINVRDFCATIKPVKLWFATTDYSGRMPSSLVSDA